MPTACRYLKDLGLYKIGLEKFFSMTYTGYVLPRDTFRLSVVYVTVIVCESH